MGRWKLGNIYSDLTVTTNNIKDTIESLPTYQASGILGVWISPDGTLTLKNENLRKITARWADRIRSSNIRRANAWYFSQSTMNKYLDYPLLDTTMIETQYQYFETTELGELLQSSVLPINI